MPPKKENSGADASTLMVGFDDKETKLIAAAFLSSLGPDKYDYELMATLTGNTAGSLKKMWPPVKRKAIEAHSSFAKFLGTEGGNVAAPKATGGRKRKATTDTEGEDVDVKSAGGKSDTANKSDSKAKTKKKAPAAKPKGRPAKKTKKEEVKAEEDSADGGDGLDTEEDVEDEA